MEPEKDIFEEWADKLEKRPWIVRKLRFIPLWWNHEGKYYHKMFRAGVKNLIYWFQSYGKTEIGIVITSLR